MANKDINQSGRSMVEMLGVLAVIGVLSVAGIAAYSNAMNRHRANELLNEANRRATILALQITAGRSGSSLSIDEFSNNATGNGTFASPSYTSGAKTFTMSLTGVTPAVCAQMKTFVGTNSIMAIEGECAENVALTLRFNKDLSRGVSEDNQNQQGSQQEEQEQNSNEQQQEPAAAGCQIANCASCDGGVCTACNSGYRVLGGECVNAECGVDHCQTCWDDFVGGLCSACEPGYYDPYMMGEKCVPQ